MTDYAATLSREARGAHAQFHEYVLELSREKQVQQYFFFEGDDDPVFYVAHLMPFLGTQPYKEFVCDGRSEVVNAQILVARDGRGTNRTHFFIDKDHNDLTSGPSALAPSVFETYCYSFENYLVCERVVRRFWVERLRLPSTDARLAQTIEQFHVMHSAFLKRMRILMAVVLLGRGMDGRKPLKLNLNNVNLDNVFLLDFLKQQVRWTPQAIQHFLRASNMTQSGLNSIASSEIRQLCRKYLSNNDAKVYVRGKFELWFLVKFLSTITRNLATRRPDGQPRARPTENLSRGNCLVQLAPLAPCPKDLSDFLISRLGNPIQ